MDFAQVASDQSGASNTNYSPRKLALGGSLSGERSNGEIAEILYFDRVLTTGERAQIEGYLAHKWGLDSLLPGGHAHKSSAPAFPAPDFTNGLVAYYPFDGNASDMSGNGRDGTVVGATLGVDRHGTADRAYLFDGSDDRIKIGAAALNGANAFTFSMWTKFVNAPDQHFLSAANSGEDNEIILSLNSNVFKLYYKGSLASGNALSTTSWLNSWKHIVLARASATQPFGLFADGSFKQNYTASSGTPSISTNGLWLGAEQDSVGGGWEAGNFFNGSIDDVRIYDRALSASEVAALYQLESTLPNPPPTDLNSTTPLAFAENQPIGTVVGEFNATDPDAGATLTYHLVSGIGDGNNSLFTLEANGTLKTATTFDYESNASTYVVRVQVTDEHNATIAGDFTVTLTDANDPATGTVTISGTAGAPQSLLDDLVAYYPLDDGSGLTASDQKGNRDGTLNGLVNWSTGKLNGGLEFSRSGHQNGSSTGPTYGNGWVEANGLLGSNGVLNNTDSYTFSAWAKWASYSGPNPWGYMIWGANTSSGGNLMRVGANQGASGLFAHQSHGLTGGSVSWADQQWHLCTLAFGPDGNADFYVDGAILVTKSADTGLERESAWSSAGHFQFGMEMDSDSATDGWHGKLDELAIWNRELSAQDINALYNNGAGIALTPVAPPTVGQTLTVSNNLADGDGLGSIRYHWLKDGQPSHGGNVKDGTNGVDGLNAANRMTISPDGKHVYVIAINDRAITWHEKNATTGALTFGGYVKDGENGVDGLRGAREVAISSDGNHVYAVGAADDGISWYDRNATTGALTFRAFLKDNQNGRDGLNGAQSLSISPDGKNIYVAGREEDAVSWVDRNTTSGEITFNGFLKNGNNNVTHLNFPVSVRVSSDGKHVYIVGREDNAISWFERNATNGDLTFSGFVENGANGISNLLAPENLILTSGGDFLYVSSPDANATLCFSRDSTTGNLTYLSSVVDGVNGVSGIKGAYFLSLSPNEEHLYVSAKTDYSIAWFDRNGSSGALSYLSKLVYDSDDYIPTKDPTGSKVSADGNTSINWAVRATTSLGSLETNNRRTALSKNWPDLPTFRKRRRGHPFSHCQVRGWRILHPFDFINRDSARSKHFLPGPHRFQLPERGQPLVLRRSEFHRNLRPHPGLERFGGDEHEQRLSESNHLRRKHHRVGCEQRDEHVQNVHARHGFQSRHW